MTLGSLLLPLPWVAAEPEEFPLLKIHNANRAWQI